MPRVLSDEQAKAAVHKIQAILSGDLSSTIAWPQRESDVLSDPNHWDGNLAVQPRARSGPRTPPRSTL